MALYHLSLSLIKRSTGRSIVAAAAYRAGERLVDERTGEVHDYRRKGHVDFKVILTPKVSPDWVQDRNSLWNAVEVKERRKDAQLGRECEVALPRELNHDEQRALVLSFVQREFVGTGMIADVTIHRPIAADGQEQAHAHVLLTLRAIDANGFGPKVRDWNDKALAEGWRKAWAGSINKALMDKGLSERVDHRSYQRRGIDAEPTVHLGPFATRMERRARQDAKRSSVPYSPRSRIAIENTRRQRRNALRTSSCRAVKTAKGVILEAKRGYGTLIDALTNPDPTLADDPLSPNLDHALRIFKTPIRKDQTR